MFAHIRQSTLLGLVSLATLLPWLGGATTAMARGATPVPAVSPVAAPEDPIATPTTWQMRIDEVVVAPYDDPEIGSGVVEVAVTIDSGILDAYLIHDPDVGSECEIQYAYGNGYLSSYMTNECDLELFLRALDAAFPGQVDPEVYVPLFQGPPKPADDDDNNTPSQPPLVDPSIGREDDEKSDALCLQAKGECAGAFLGAAVSGVGIGLAVSAVGTPAAGVFAGALVGVAGAAVAVLICAGGITAHCDTDDLMEYLALMFGDSWFLFFDVEDFVDVEDFMETLLQHLAAVFPETGEDAGLVVTDGVGTGIMAPLVLDPLVEYASPTAVGLDPTLLVAP